MPSNRPIHDLSARGVPQSWLDAQEDSPTQDLGAFVAGRDFQGLVVRRRSHGGTLFLGGLLATFIVGALWYASEAMDLVNSPWIAAVGGLAIGLVIRVACAAAGRGPRAMLAVNSFVLVAIGIAVGSAFVEVGQVYGAATSIANYEFHMRARFGNTTQLLAHAAGLVAAPVVARLGDR